MHGTDLKVSRRIGVNQPINFGVLFHFNLHCEEGRDCVADSSFSFLILFDSEKSLLRIRIFKMWYIS